MLVEHETMLCDTGELKRVSPMRETLDGLAAQCEKEILAGSFTATRREEFLAAVNAVLDFHVLASQGGTK